jgi:hypothetical protein
MVNRNRPNPFVEPPPTPLAGLGSSWMLRDVRRRRWREGPRRAPPFSHLGYFDCRDAVTRGPEQPGDGLLFQFVDSGCECGQRSRG